MSSGPTGTRVSSRPVAARSAETIAAVETTVGGSPTPLTPYGASGSGILDQLRDDRRHVERRRDQVVGEARVRDQAVAGLDLLHQREPEALRGAALDLALDRLRVDRLADVLRRADPDDARQPELDVDLGDDAHRRDREARRASARRSIWPVSGSSGARPRVVVDALDVDLAAAGALALLERGAARELDGAGRHPRQARRRRRAGRADASPSSCGASAHVVDAELGARDLEDHAVDALADLGGGAVDLGRAVRRASRTRAAQKSSKPSE